MPELKPEPVIGLPVQAIERGPSQKEISRWSRLLVEHERASYSIDRAALLLKNIYTTWVFALDNEVILPTFDPLLEDQFYKVQESFEKSKSAIRGVIDHKLGIRLSGLNDLDIVEPEQQSFEGLILPIALGLVVVSAAIATAIWQSTIATKIANEYRKILFDTDKIFCSNAKSELCKKWKQFKIDRKYEQNTNMANSLSSVVKKGITTVAGGLATGLIVAIGLVVFMRSK